MAYIKDLPEVHFGEVEETPFNWREVRDVGEEDDAEENAPASKDLIDMLGFDPDKEDYEEEEEDESDETEKA